MLDIQRVAKAVYSGSMKNASLLPITYELLGLVIERSSNIVSLFKVLENIRIDA
jgi:hypothetical protein